MSDNYFIDTNILLYLLSDDHNKKGLAKKILTSCYFVSTQVLNEFSNISIKKFNLSVTETKNIIQVISKSTKVCILNEKTIIEALSLKERYQFQFYDCLILATALENNCSIVFSEDMQHQQIIENKLTIINPFL